MTAFGKGHNQTQRKKGPRYDRLIKVLVIGDSGAGKSSLMFRVADDTFTPSFITTIGVDYKDKMFDIDGQPIKAQIWDTAGQDRFRSITTAYFRGAHCVVFVFDLTDDKSFNNIKNWVSTLKMHASNPVNMLMIGNKTDLKEIRLIDYERAEELAKQNGMEYIETSAKTGKNVYDAFFSIVKATKDRLDQYDKEMPAKSAVGPVSIKDERSTSGSPDKPDGCCT